MRRYLKAAFFLGIDVPLVGRLPLNALVLACFAILGFGHPGFWLLAAGLETAYLAALTSSPRFQNWVDAVGPSGNEDESETKRAALVAQLQPPAQRRLSALEAKCGKALAATRNSDNESFVADANSDALRRLQWFYLKLLIAQQFLTSGESRATEAEIRKQTSQLENDLKSDKLATALRESKTATLRILQKRLANLQRREQSLAEIDSDLTRIEAQVDLALDSASLRGQSLETATNIDLVSQSLDPGLYGDSESTVAALDESFGAPLRQPTATRQG